MLPPVASRRRGSSSTSVDLPVPERPCDNDRPPLADLSEDRAEYRYLCVGIFLEVLKVLAVCKVDHLFGTHAFAVFHVPSFVERPIPNGFRNQRVLAR